MTGEHLSLDFLHSLRILSPLPPTFCSWIEIRSTARTTRFPPLRRAGPPMSGRSHHQPQRILPPPLCRRFPRRRVAATARRTQTRSRSRRPDSSPFPYRRLRHHRRAGSARRYRPHRPRPGPRNHLGGGPPPRPRTFPTLRRRPTHPGPARHFRPGPRTRHPRCPPTDQRLSVRSDGAGGWRQVCSVSPSSRCRSCRVAS